MAQRWKKAADVELDALALVELTRAWQQSLKHVGVFLHGPGAATLRQLEEGRQAERWLETKVEEVLETTPCGNVASSSWIWMYHNWAPSSRLYEAIQTFSSSMMRCWWKYDSQWLMKMRGSDLPS